MKKILIVDDQPGIRELIKVTLEVSDYQIFSAETAQQALKIIHTEHPHVILLDIMLPEDELDGLEVCRRLKADPVTSNIVIILLSAKGQRQDIEAGLAAGADDYIPKPFSPIALIQRVEKALPNHHNPIYKVPLTTVKQKHSV